MVNRRNFVVVTLATAVGVVAFGQVCKSQSNELVVGAYLSLSGADSTFGTDTRDGIELAMDDLKAKGGIKGKAVKVLYEDDKSTTQEATNKVQQLIDRDHAIAILGEVASSRSMAGGLVCNKKKVPMVTPSSTAVEVTKDREYVFRTCFTDAQQGDVAARFVVETLKKKTAALFFVAQDTYSSGLASTFKASFEKQGGKIVIDKGYQKGETNFTTYLQEIKGAQPEIIFAPVYYNDMVLIARQAKGTGIPGSIFVGGDGWDSADLIEGAGDLLEGAYFTNHYAPDVPWPNSQKFVTAFKAKYHHDPSSLAAQGYDAASLLFDAIGRATEPTPEAVKIALAATSGFAGATGSLTIDKEHNANKPIVVVQVRSKKFAYASQLLAN